MGTAPKSVGEGADPGAGRRLIRHCICTEPIRMRVLAAAAAATGLAAGAAWVTGWGPGPGSAAGRAMAERPKVSAEQRQKGRPKLELSPEQRFAVLRRATVWQAPPVPVERADLERDADPMPR